MHYPTSKNVPNLHKLERCRIMKMQWPRIAVSLSRSYDTKKQRVQPKLQIILTQRYITAFPLLQGSVLAESKE